MLLVVVMIKKISIIRHDTICFDETLLKEGNKEDTWIHYNSCIQTYWMQVYSDERIGKTLRRI